MSSKWKRVHHNGVTLFDVGILPDGTLRNPNGYPDDEVRSAVLAADARRHKRRSRAAKQAAVTRNRRQEKQVYAVAARIVQGGCIGPTTHCVICGRALGDQQSIERGIGSECWQTVLQAITRTRQSATQGTP